MEADIGELMLPPWAAFPGKRLRGRVVVSYPEPPEWEGFYAHSQSGAEHAAKPDPGA
jgi:hypothetical protein